MRKSYFSVTVILLLLFAFAPSGIIENNQYDLILHNISLIDGTGNEMQEGRNIYISNGKIVMISAKPQEQAKSGISIDGRGKYIMPGLIEGHAHPSGIDTDPEARKNYPHRLKTMIHYGVTTVVLYGGSSGSYDSMSELQKSAENGTMVSPRIFYSSLFITKEGAHPMKTYPSGKYVDGKTMYILKDSTQVSSIIQEAKSHNTIGIKLIVEDGPTPPFIERMHPSLIQKVVKEAHKATLPVYAHVSDMEEVKICVEAGVDNLVHLAGISPDFNEDRGTIEKMVKNKISWVTTFALGKSLIFYPLNTHWLDREEIRNVYDSTQIANIPEPEEENVRATLKAFAGSDTISIENFVRPMAQDVARLLEVGVNVVLGTDVGGDDYIFAGLSMHEEMEMMQMGGIPPIKIIKMATLNAAKMLGMEKDMGSLEKGKAADFMILTKNPVDDITNTLSIEKVFKAGLEQPRIMNR